MEDPKIILESLLALDEDKALRVITNYIRFSCTSISDISNIKKMCEYKTASLSEKASKNYEKLMDFMDVNITHEAMVDCICGKRKLSEMFESVLAYSFTKSSLNGLFNFSGLQDKIRTIDFSKKTFSDLVGSIYLCPKNFPGIDLIAFEPDNTNKIVKKIHLIQVKHGMGKISIKGNSSGYSLENISCKAMDALNLVKCMLTGCDLCSKTSIEIESKYKIRRKKVAIENKDIWPPLTRKGKPCSLCSILSANEFCSYHSYKKIKLSESKDSTTDEEIIKDSESEIELSYNKCPSRIENKDSNCIKCSETQLCFRHIELQVSFIFNNEITTC